MPALDLCFLHATQLTRMMRSGQVSAVEVMAAHLAQVERWNPRVNAMVTLVAEQAMTEALRADHALARGDATGPLHGLPVAHKDLHDTEGIRTTYGSPLFAEHVPERDTLAIERIKCAGAISIGKTNTPEFGAGSQTFNPVFGATLNPYDTTKTCGGSSGGAAVALACGMAAVADGSDMGGSLRNPASFCNVVGLRPSPGRVPNWPALSGWSTLAVVGPMARNVEDTALLLSAMAGPDLRSPISIEEPGSAFLRPLQRDFQGVRIAWAKDLGGLPFDKKVNDAVNAQVKTFQALGCVVEEAEPDFQDADDVFRVLRAWAFELGFGCLLSAPVGQVKETVIQEIEAGLRLTGPQLSRAERQRTSLYERTRVFMERYEFFVLPVSQVPPFDVTAPFVREIAGVRMESYIDWMKSCYFISVLGNPAISVPGGFTPEGLPVGIQIVGRHRDDWGVLQLAYAFEQATGFAKRRPPLAN